MDKPIYLLDNEKSKWTSTAWMTREQMEVGYCPASGVDGVKHNHEDGSCRYCHHIFLQCSNPMPYTPEAYYTKETKEEGLQDLPILAHVGRWIISDY